MSDIVFQLLIPGLFYSSSARHEQNVSEIIPSFLKIKDNTQLSPPLLKSFLKDKIHISRGFCNN